MQIKSRDWQNPMSLSAKYAAYVRNVMWWICCLGLDAGLEGEEGDQGNQPDSLPYPTENPWG